MRKILLKKALKAEISLNKSLKINAKRLLYLK